DVTAAAGRAGHLLVAGHVEDPHARPRGTSRPKKGPVRTPPKSTTSSLRTQVRPRAKASRAGDGGEAGPAPAGPPAPAWPPRGLAVRRCRRPCSHSPRPTSPT